MANQIGNTNMPVANQAAADRASTTNRARMQANTAQSAGQAMMSGPAVAQKAAGQAAQAQGQIAAQAQQTVIQKSVGQAQSDLHAADLRHKEQQTIHTEAMANRHTSLKSKMSELGRDVKKELLDDQLEFDKSQRETRFKTQRQLQDFMNIKGMDQQAMKNYQQSVEAAIQKDVHMMESAYKTLVQAESQASTDRNRMLDKEANARIKQAKKVLEEKLAKSRRRAGTFKRNMGIAKTAAGVGLMFVPGGQAAGASLAVSGASDAVEGEQQANS